MNRFMRVSGFAVILAITCRGYPALSDTIDINGVARSYIFQRADAKPAFYVYQHAR